MPSNRFLRRGEKREVTPFADDDPSRVVVPAEDIPAEWRQFEAPPNFTWVGPDELAGMGWPKSRDQVRFLVAQGIDHLITLSSDKIPPHYAFPELKWSLIPVEDFTGPSIRDIKKFINYMDEARKYGEAIGVHCAEGRGRTGVMCACYLIYYHDLKPWDAIRIMRRQRPGSVERKTQEDTVVRFYQLLQDYGKHSLEDLEEKEKEWKEQQRTQQLTRLNCDNSLLQHTATFYGPGQKAEVKVGRLERMQRMRRCRSMPKISPEDEAERAELDFRRHLANFYHDRGATRCRSQTRDRPNPLAPCAKKAAPSSASEFHRDDCRAVTPCRALKENLRPVSVRRSETRETSVQPTSSSSSSASSSAGAESAANSGNKCDFTRHFKDFMSSSGGVKRVRSFSQPKDKNKGDGKGGKDNKENDDSVKWAKDDREGRPSSTWSKDSTEEKYVDDRAEQEKDTKKEEKEEVEKKRADLHQPARNNDSCSEDNKYASADRARRAHSDGEQQRHSGERPPQPNYRPKYTIDCSTYSYYTRVRARAAAAAAAASAAAAAEVATNTINNNDVDGEIDMVHNPGARRSRTAERDLCVTVTVSETFSLSPTASASSALSSTYTTSSSSSSSSSSSPSPSSSSATSSTTSSSHARHRPDRHVSSSSAPANASIRSSKTGGGVSEMIYDNRNSCDDSNNTYDRRRAFSTSASGSKIVLPYQRKTSDDILLRRGAGGNRYCNSNDNDVDNEDHNDNDRDCHHRARTAVFSRCTSSADRTLLESTADRLERRRLLQAYRRSRTGPLDNEKTGPTCNGNLNHANFKNNNSIGYQSSNTTTTYSSATSSLCNNSYTSSVRRWTSASSSVPMPDTKPASSYSPFARDNWKRTNQRYNYSRFLPHNRETYV